MVETKERTYGPRVRVEYDRSAACLRLYDEIVAGDIDNLRTAIDDLNESRSGEPEVVDIDMEKLDHIDRSGLAVLAGLANRETRDTPWIRVSHATPPVSLVLHLTGLDQTLRLQDTDSRSRYTDRLAAPN